MAMRRLDAPDRPALLRALKRERLHVEPRALDQSPPQVRRRFAHVWAPADLLLAHLRAWPAGLIAFWLAAPAGHIVFSASPSAYLPGGLPWREGSLAAVARLALADLVAEDRPASEAVAHLVDHLLGSRGAGPGPWLSDGAGATADLRAVGERLLELARLGYGPTEPRAYFAWAFSAYWLDRRALNVADPQAERLLRTTLCDEAWWKTAGATDYTNGHE